MEAVSVRPSILRRLARGLRLAIYPIPYLARAYLRRVVARHAVAMVRGAICLDLGAGVAPYRQVIERSFPVGLYIAFDIAPSDATTLVGDATKLPLRDDAVDLVVSMDTLQHIPDVDRVFDEIRRVVAPGGLLVLSFPFSYGECDMMDFHRWSIEGMKHELRRRGFAIVDARPRGGTFFAWACALQWVMQHIIPGGRGSWRREFSALSVLRSMAVQVLTLPTTALAWVALAIDCLLPRSGIYMGGLLTAKRTDTGER